ncbi:ABC transporter permease [Glycomyces scopariae]|uniref:Peptide/nickel transport system permease protein n=1 Tax=Glycomyces sambucus TaxID=380244 RepID=A0A1G9FTL6_9ACTN|nr:ABC transporter permease [Glycomyces sambucus]SDK91483.1 peptide/nickel transport system permease protein [Glycomyces sambucus]
MGRYFRRKLLIYGLTFVIAVSINFAVPRLMPGDPVARMLTRNSVANLESSEAMRGYFNELFGLDVPLWQQYLNYWAALFRGDLGVSVFAFPSPVATVVADALPYTLALLLPSILLSWFVGNALGAMAARNKLLDNGALPIGYVLTAVPYMWLAILLAWVGGIILGWFPVAGGYSFALTPAFTWTFIVDLVHHWFLPFLSLFVVALGGWAIGMRNLVIYELESDYSNYLQALGAPNRLVRRYAFRNAVLPQITGLALQLGVVVGGALVTEVVFAYPGLGSLLLNAISSQDFFLLQGILLFIVIGVLVFNFLADVVYVLVDPRTRLGLEGGQS